MINMELSSKDGRAFALQILTGRWLMFYASILIISVSGTIPMFPLYSKVIKSSLDFDQSTMNLLSSFNDVGYILGILSGLISDVASPRIILAIGALMNFFGYLMVWLAVAKKITEVQVWHMCLYILIGANSSCFIATGVMVTSVRNFPGGRAIVLAILSGYQNLSPVIITQLYSPFHKNSFESLYDSNSNSQYHFKSIILLVACLPTITTFVMLPVIRHHTIIQDQNDSRVFNKFLYMTSVISFILLTTTILQSCTTSTQADYSSMIILLLLLLVPFTIVFVEEHKIWKGRKRQTTGENPAPTVRFTKLEQTVHEEISCWKNILKHQDRGEDHTILQAIFTFDMLTLLLATTCGLGGPLAFINNLSQIGTSLDYSNGAIVILQPLISIFICLGKIIQAIVSPILMTKFKLPRPVILATTLALPCVGYLLVAFSVPNGLYLASVVIGCCFGANWPWLITSEIFGLKYHSTLYNIGSATNPIGSFLLDMILVPHFYNIEASKRNLYLHGKLICKGIACYKLAFIIISIVTLFGVVVSLILAHRTTEFYKSGMGKKSEEEDSAIHLDVIEA